MTRTRQDELEEQAREYHAKHPVVWELFCKYAFDRIRLGFKHYSARAIFHRIRWDTEEAGDGKTEFKLASQHTPWYARQFMQCWPEHAYVPRDDGKKGWKKQGFFRTRRQPSLDCPPLGGWIAKPADCPYEMPDPIEPIVVAGTKQEEVAPVIRSAFDQFISVFSDDESDIDLTDEKQLGLF